MKQKVFNYTENIIEISSEELLDLLDEIFYEFLRRRFMEVFYGVKDHGADDAWHTICAMENSGKISAVEMYTTVSRMREYYLSDILDFYQDQNMELTAEQLKKWASEDQAELIKFLLD